ncbi:hypothetical protein L9F63_001639, partial [Diploptera punctata]
MNFHNILKIIIIATQLVGGVPFKTHKNYRNIIHRLTFVTQQILSFVIFMSVLATNIYSQTLWFQTDIQISFVISGFSASFTCLCSYIAGVVISTLYFQKTLNMLNKLLCHFHQHQENLNKIIKRKIVIPLILGGLWISLYVILYALNIDLNIWYILFSCSSVIIHFSMYVSDVQFITFVIIIYKCFYLINCKLVHMYNNINMSNLINSTFKTSSEIVGFPEIDFQKEYVSMDNTRSPVNTLSKLHGSLRMLAQHVNAIYSAHLLLHTLIIYSRLSLSLYNIYYLVILSET